MAGTRERLVALAGTALLLAAALVAVEVALRVASLASLGVRRTLAAPWERDAVTVPDERLGYRGNPLTPDHDRHGYRNADRPERVEAVTFGDSQTYGFTAPEDAWPRRLAARLGSEVYNMALPGYGPGQALLLLPDALALQPRHVLLAPYLGNDLFDCFVLARRHPELREGVPAELWARAEAREREGRIDREHPQPFGTTPAEAASGLRQWLSRHLRLYGLARALRDRLRPAAGNPLLSREFASAAAALTPEDLRWASVFEGAGWRTILTSPYRRWALDDRDPRLRAGFEVLWRASVRLAERARAGGAHTLVAIVPTKESVFAPRVADPSAHPGLAELVRDELRLRGELVERLEAHGVAVLDLLPALRDAPEQPYYEDIDSHPNASGNRRIAEAVAARLGLRGPTGSRAAPRSPARAGRRSAASRRSG